MAAAAFRQREGRVRGAAAAAAGFRVRAEEPRVAVGLRACTGRPRAVVSVRAVGGGLCGALCMVCVRVLWGGLWTRYVCWAPCGGGMCVWSLLRGGFCVWGGVHCGGGCVGGVPGVLRGCGGSAPIFSGTLCVSVCGEGRFRLALCVCEGWMDMVVMADRGMYAWGAKAWTPRRLL